MIHPNQIRCDQMPSHPQQAMERDNLVHSIFSARNGFFDIPFRPFPVTDLNQAQEQRWIKHYNNSHRILLVGEGDFSFSGCLARAFGSAPNMVTTSLDPLEFVVDNYSNALLNIVELLDRGCKVMHGVDATEIAGYRFLEGMRFDRIVFNFPHVGFTAGESRRSHIARNQRLIKSFLESAKLLLADGGEIHITHKSAGFFLQWNIVSLGLSSGLSLMEEVEFQLGDYPRYSNKYGFGGDRAFNCDPSKTYKFGFPH